ncbi:hypothetical protein LZ009_06155 [Ramlibacter sp. XY19]|uniref:hypothetical protein n=1 Tax=Ramlibacter paludis TaxID=2908000 RepID=UPI0023DCA423|nr:hypothetical protein [Ramlibacter paludis]MCG2592361.1 hypothetical protein [Ramlibacter paludis]
MEPNEFFRSYAMALLVWQHVEAALFTFFFGLFEKGADLKRVGAIYYAQDSLRREASRGRGHCKGGSKSQADGGVEEARQTHAGGIC